MINSLDKDKLNMLMETILKVNKEIICLMDKVFLFITMEVNIMANSKMELKMVKENFCFPIQKNIKDNGWMIKFVEKVLKFT